MNLVYTVVSHTKLAYTGCKKKTKTAESVYTNNMATAHRNRAMYTHVYC